MIALGIRVREYGVDRGTTRGLSTRTGRVGFPRNLRISQCGRLSADNHERLASDASELVEELRPEKLMLTCFFQ